MVEERKVWPNLSPAAIGLIGVLFGPVISTGANYLVFSGKEAIEAAKAELSRTTELKIAIRVLTQELEEQNSSAVMLYQQRVWSHIEFPMDAWRRYKEVLARELSTEDWHQLHLAIFLIRHSYVVDFGRCGDDATDEQVEAGIYTHNAIALGLKALTKYATIPIVLFYSENEVIHTLDRSSPSLMEIQ